MWPSITNNSVFRYHIRLIIFIHTAVKSAMQASSNELFGPKQTHFTNDLPK